jgi:hypothetical protein
MRITTTYRNLVKEEANKQIEESAEGIQKAKENKDALMKLATTLDLSKTEISILLNDLKKLTAPSANVIHRLAQIIANNPSIARKEIKEETLDEAIPPDQVTYFNLARLIKKTGTSNSSDTKFVSGLFVLTTDKKDGMFGSISKIDKNRKVLWTVSVEPMKELHNAPKLVFKGITRDEFIKLKNANLNEGSDEDDELNEEQWVVYQKDTKRKITPFKTRDAAKKFVDKNGGELYSSEYFHDHKKEIMKEDISESVSKQTNGVKWDLAPESDRLKGNYYVAFNKLTKKMVAYGLTKKGAEMIAKTDKAFVAIHADDVLKEDVEELTEDKLQNDIKSLKKIGWKLPKIIPFFITKGDEYDVKMTADLITMYFNDGDGKAKKNTIPYPGHPGLSIAATKKSPPKGWGMKKAKWPKDPPKSKINDPSHAEAFIAQVIDSGESEDISGGEAYKLMRTAGYTEKARMAVIKNMGWDDAEFRRYLARNGK